MPAEKSFLREGYLREEYRYFHLKDTAGQERDFHFHDFDKIVILLSGRVDYIVEGVTYGLRPWDVLLVGHHMIHKAVIDVKEPYDRIILYLDGQWPERAMPEAGLMTCFETADRTRRHLVHFEGEERAALSSCVSAIENTRDDGRFGAKALRDTLVLQMLIYINRMAMTDTPRAESHERVRDEKISAALSYINENLANVLSVEELAERVYLSKYHFMRLFKAQTGSTVHAYIRQKRLLYAARLIREGVAVNKAAADCGFADYSSFYRAFRECFGVSPGQLR